MIQVGLDYTLFIQIFQFLLIVFFANLLILKPVKATIDARNAKIDGLLENARSQLDAVEESKAAYEKNLASVREEIAQYRGEMKKETVSRIEAMMGRAKEEVSVTTEKAMADIRKAAAEARAGLDNEVKSISDMIYRAISGDAA